MPAPHRYRKPAGQLRQSQLITTFGPGAMLDLPNHSVLVSGLDEWLPAIAATSPVTEPRLTRKLSQVLGHPVDLRTPPLADDDLTGPLLGVRAWQFPEWFVTQDAIGTGPDGARSRRLVKRSGLNKGRFADGKKNYSVVPVRFVRACHKGHIDDIDWYFFVHGQDACRRPLWMDETGTSGDLSEIRVRCECGRSRPMTDATLPQTVERPILGLCNGKRLWLGPHAEEGCSLPFRLLIRTASNAYFAQVMSVISLPDRDEAVKEAVDAVWDFVSTVEEVGEVRYERKKEKVKAALADFTDQEVFAEIQARRGGRGEAEEPPPKWPELETLMAAKEGRGDDAPDGTFDAEALPRAAWDHPWMKRISKVVLVHRLREVVAQLGFTRFEAVSPDEHGELDTNVQRASIAREVRWLPAVENRGEGLFLLFDKAAVEAWAHRPAVLERGRRLEAGAQGWQTQHPGAKRRLRELPYVMLHTFSHLLMTAVSLECGYPASSIRERVYAVPEIGYGVLLYTGTPDAEGTLGGLVAVGRRVAEHVRAALELGRLCSNDPICAQHDPGDVHEGRFLHGAACHGCLLVSETSCEQHNEFLDRALVVPTVSDGGAAFFGEAG